MVVKCGPPPAEFSPNLSAEWRRDGILITEDNEHSFSTQNGTATLTVSRFFSTDNGKEIDPVWSSQKTIFMSASGDHL